MPQSGKTAIILYHTETPSGAPSAGNLSVGELAVNIVDKKIFTKDTGGSIVTLVGTLGSQNANAVAITGGSITGITDLAVADGGTGASTAAGARTNLGASTVGANLFTLTDPSAVTYLRLNADNTVTALSASDFRTAIGAGTGAGTVTSVGGTGTVSGLTLTGTVTGSGNLTLGGTLSVDLTTSVTGALPVANGGTGASTAADARTNLGLGTIATQAADSVTITGGSISGITDLAVADGGTGASTAADARTNLGLGTIATQAANSVSITGGSITGITDLAVADGGTGASTAADARTNLGLGSMATQAASAVAITGGTAGLKYAEYDVVAVTPSAGVVTIDWSQGTVFNVTGITSNVQETHTNVPTTKGRVIWVNYTTDTDRTITAFNMPVGITMVRYSGSTVTTLRTGITHTYNAQADGEVVASAMERTTV